jgi:lipoprotein-anchoring transpeptidase ErfK/SrfK
MLRARLVEPLDKPVTVTFEDEKFTLSPAEIDVRADIEGMVDEAQDESQEGGLPTRLVRYATGGEVDREISPRISYSNDAVDDFIAGVAAKVNREPVDASIDPTPTSLTPVPAQDGVQLRAEELRDGLEGALQSPTSRTVKATVARVEPEVTQKELASETPSYITIDRNNFTLRYFENLKLAKEYTIAVGAVGFDTPAGLYHIQNKAVNPSWSVPDADWTGGLAGQVIPPGPDNPLKARWMGIFDGAGIHGTDDVGSLGSAASHGCVRMSVPDVVELYDHVDVGTPTYIF